MWKSGLSPFVSEKLNEYAFCCIGMFFANLKNMFLNVMYADLKTDIWPTRNLSSIVRIIRVPSMPFWRGLRCWRLDIFSSAQSLSPANSECCPSILFYELVAHMEGPVVEQLLYRAFLQVYYYTRLLNCGLAHQLCSAYLSSFYPFNV